MKVVILAGGLGTRISEESYLRPKPMIDVGGSPILWHIMKYYSTMGHNEFIICCGYKGHMIKEYFANYYLHRSDITFDYANDNQMIIHNNVAEPWKITVVDTGLNSQTGGRIKRIRAYTNDEPFMMTYGDGLGDVDLHALENHHRNSNVVATLTAVQPKGRFGVLGIEDATSLVTGFREKAQEDTGWINGGFMILNPDVFKYIDGDETPFEGKPLETLSSRRELGVYKHAGFWQCMDTQRDKSILEEMWLTDCAPWKIWGDGGR